VQVAKANQPMMKEKLENHQYDDASDVMEKTWGYLKLTQVQGERRAWDSPAKGGVCDQQHRSQKRRPNLSQAGGVTRVFNSLGQNLRSGVATEEDARKRRYGTGGKVFLATVGGKAYEQQQQR